MIVHGRDEAWSRFADALAAVGEVDRAEVAEPARLIDDLGLDSLALTEVAVMVNTVYGVDLLEVDAFQDWEGVTAGDLFAVLPVVPAGEG
jgi:acyl carrier protein